MTTKKASNHACAVCGKKAARILLISKVFGRGANRVLIEGIPTLHCHNCGSHYLDGPTMDIIDQVRINPGAHAVQQSIATVKLVA